jgi:hypothetical protein
LASKHGIALGREVLRQMMIGGGLWPARSQKTAQDHQWLMRRSCRGELVQWDTSDHDWLEGRGERLYQGHRLTPKLFPCSIRPIIPCRSRM